MPDIRHPPTPPAPPASRARGRHIGLFGGTFDPPHRAHLALARTALEALHLDEVRWIPAGQPWQKTRVITPALHREAMVRAALEGEAGFVLERCELEREGPSYMVETVAALQSREPQARWVLIIGQDQYAGLHTWHRIGELLQRVELAVAARAGVEVTPNPSLAEHSGMAASPVRQVPLPPMAISSTDIRQRVLRGEPVDDLVPPAVARYIARHRLYRKDAAPAI